MRKKHPYPFATLLIVLATLVIYLWFSQGQPYIVPLSQLDPFGVTSYNLLGAVSYSFFHIGLKHLIGNVVVLLAMGMLVERHIGNKHLLGLYFASSIMAGAGYALYKPTVWVIGASAAISGLVLTAYLFDFKKASILLFVVLLSIPMFIFPITDAGLAALQETHEEEIVELVQEKNGEQGRSPATRADLRFGGGPEGRIFLLNKRDGVIRLLVP